MKKLLVLALTSLTIFAQGIPFVGSNGVLSWLPNPPEDGVIRYNIYIIAGTTTTLLTTTTSTNVNLINYLSKNGNYGNYITAVNINGEGPASTNVFYKYFANKPIQVIGVDVK